MMMTRTLVIGSAFVQGILIARFLGPEGNGVFFTVLVLPEVLNSLGNLGLSQSVAHWLGKRKASLDDIVDSVFTLWTITAVLSLVLVAAGFATQGVFRFGWMVVTLALLNTPLNLLVRYCHGVAFGRQRVEQVAVSQTVQAASNLLLICLFVGLLDLGLAGAFAAITIGLTIQSAYMVSRVLVVRRPRFRFVARVARGLLVHGIAFALALFVLSLNYRIDIFMLGFYVPQDEVGIYGRAARFAELLWQVPLAMTAVIFSHSTGAADVSAFVQRVAKLLRITLPIAALVVGLIWLTADWLIPMLYGGRFARSSGIVQILLPGVLAGVSFKLMNGELAGRGRPLVAMWVYLGALIVKIALSFWWIPSSGINGAAWASTVGYIVGAIVFAAVYAWISNVTVATLLVPRLSDWQGAWSNLASMGWFGRGRQGEQS